MFHAKYSFTWVIKYFNPSKGSIIITFLFFSNLAFYRKIYELNEKDVIFVSSPPTFDPFMIDICLALQYGASLVMVDNSLRCNSSLLLDILFPLETEHYITLMQITPSLFMRWKADEIKCRIFSSSSRLRILAFGGEPFPTTNSISNWIDSKMPRIFNLYGLTEMSCWSSIYEITEDDIIQKRDIPIGSPIDEHTTFEINCDGELLLKSKIRKCFQSQLNDTEVIDNNFEFVLRTADVVEKHNNAIYFKTRLNSIIKFYGQKLDLSEIESIAKSILEVTESICVFDKNRDQINLFVKVDNQECREIKKEITKSLHGKVKAFVKIHVVNEFPLSSHGKVCKEQLMAKVQNENDETQSLQGIFMNLLGNILGMNIKFVSKCESNEKAKILKTECDSSFIFLGGTSLKAIQIVDEIERKTSFSTPKLLTMLLDEHTTIREILNFLATQSSESEGIEINDAPTISYRWSIDMLKCIDATPTICFMRNNDTVISVGSHSKLLYNIQISNGQILSKLTFPDRIECQVTQMNDLGIVGCYDGCLYCFEIMSGGIKWAFNSNGMIKSRALIIDSMIIFGNYNAKHNLWCLNSVNGTLIWSQRIGTKSIFANLVQFHECKFIACTLDGIVALIDSQSSKIIWSFDTKSPIFSTPMILKKDSTYVILASVNGNIFCLNETGVIVWIHEINGNIFSSFDCFTSQSNDNHIYIVFGSQNTFLYCLAFDVKTNECNEYWKYKTNSSIRATPLVAVFHSKKFIVNCSSNGSVEMIDQSSGYEIQRHKIDGELFSSPVISNDNLFIASRNNKLFCIDLHDIFENTNK